MSTRAVTTEGLGAWLFKVSPHSASDLPGAVADGLDRITSRCVADNYRSRMMRPGDRVLLTRPSPHLRSNSSWVSKEQLAALSHLLDAGDAGRARTS